MALQKIDLLVEGEGYVLHRSTIHLVITGEIRNHEVIGIEFMVHHPLALDDLLLRGFEPDLHGSHLLGPLNISDVEHPLMHHDGLRVLHHLRQVRVDDLLEELVLGGTWGCHDNLDLSEK